MSIDLFVFFFKHSLAFESSDFQETEVLKQYIPKINEDEERLMYSKCESFVPINHIMEEKRKVWKGLSTCISVLVKKNEIKKYFIVEKDISVEWK